MAKLLTYDGQVIDPTAYIYIYIRCVGATSGKKTNKQKHGTHKQNKWGRTKGKRNTKDINWKIDSDKERDQSETERKQQRDSERKKKEKQETEREREREREREKKKENQPWKLKRKLRKHMIYSDIERGRARDNERLRRRKRRFEETTKNVWVRQWKGKHGGIYIYVYAQRAKQWGKLILKFARRCERGGLPPKGWIGDAPEQFKSRYV